jgi:outer membrane protein OmpA-like peptidoglycan-associated protein
MRKLHRPLLLLGSLAIATPGLARADEWIVAETPAAVAVSDAQAGLFRPGVMPAVGVYADRGWLAVGLRMRAGVLRNGPTPGNHFRDPGFGGLVTGGLALRMMHAGFWIEGVGGGGMTGGDAVPSVEVGIGMTVRSGAIDLGPGARYVRVISRDAMDTFGTAQLIVVGLDIRWGAERPRQRIAVAPKVAHHAPRVERRIEPVIETPIAVDRDRDRVRDRDTSCAESLDGCPIGQHARMIDDRIVLDERVLFDLGHARVRSAGRAVIAEIAEAWKQHPEWRRITIEGHCDVRGSDQLNQALSQNRAERARTVLLRHGFAAEQIDAIGYGRSRPRDRGRTEAANERNRRVEFVIDREIPE